MWDTVDEVDPRRHVGYVSLPRPATRADVAAAVTRSRTTLLDRKQPLWTADVIDGMADRRFAIDMKIHHSLVDGIGLISLLQDSLSADPNADDGVAPWNAPGPKSVAPRASRNVRRVVAGAREAGPDAATIGRAWRRDAPLVMPYPNAKVGSGMIGSAHEIALQSWQLDRFEAIRSSSAGHSVNDVVVAACGGALRSLLLESAALPHAGLKAMIPISTRTVADADGSGNAVGSITADLGTHLTDPFERLQAVHESMRSGKELFRSVGDRSAFAWSLANVSPIYYNRFFGPRAPGREHRFATVVSTVTAPRNRLYLNGAPLVGITPIGLVTKGLDLNIALSNTADSLNFSVLTTLPNASRFVEHYERALQDLEK